jgi:hypothetical protein
MGTWVYGYGYYDPIPVPVLPDGYIFFSIYIHMSIVLSHIRTTNGHLSARYAGNG